MIIPVTGVVDGVPRRPEFRQLLAVSWFMRIVVLATPTGRVELAIHPEVLPWLLGQLVGPRVG